MNCRSSFWIAQCVIYFDGEMRHYPVDSHSGNLALCGWCPWKCKQKWGQIALYKTGSLHSYWPAGAWHLPAYVCVYAYTSCPRYGIPTVGILSVEGFAVVSGNCLFRPSVRSGVAVHASINQHYYHPLRRRLFASLAPSSPVLHTHMLSECCLIFSEGLSLLIPSTRPCRGSRSGIFRTWWQEKRSRFPPWESGSFFLSSYAKDTRPGSSTRSGTGDQ